jgi:hypothetical protein
MFFDGVCMRKMHNLLDGIDFFCVWDNTDWLE